MDDYITQTIAVYDKIAPSYAKEVASHAPRIQRRHFCSLIKRGGKILDVGCGAGRDCAYFIKKGYETTGVDLSDKLLEIARETVPEATFLKQDIRALSFLPNSFDGIWACASLLHIKHYEILATLRSWFTLLKSGGILFIHVKKGEGEVEREDPSIPGVKRSFSLFSKKQIGIYCNDAGFTVFSTHEYIGSYDLCWIDCWAKKI